MTDPDQADLSTFAPSSGTQSITRTVQCQLETSNTKNEAVQTAIDEFQAMAAYTATMLPSIDEYEWSPQNNTIYQLVTEEFDDRTVKATIAREAGQKVAEAFQAWHQRGKPGNRPQFGEGNYLRLSHQDLEVVKNDRGWGLKVSFIPYNPIWFHIVDGPYQREFLERVTDEDASTGSGELVLREDGTLLCNLTVSWEVDVYEPSDVNTKVGVDLGETILYAVAVVSDGDISQVEIESGREFRHHRERLDKKRQELMTKDDLRGLKKVRNERERYTDQVTHTASRTIVELAESHAPATIVLEDLTHYRETATEPIHDWPFAKLQEQICYKATERSLPVVFVDPVGTSITCRQCDHTSSENRNGTEFSCTQCGYEVHADVNAAINIATSFDNSVS